MESFSGSIAPGAIDSGVSAWFNRFEALLSMQEDLHQVNLPEKMKTALLFQHLSGAASQWYLSDFHGLRNRSFASLGPAIKRKFGSKLSKAQIGQMVANEKKKAAETYLEYSLRLRDMAAATTWDGIESLESNNLALSSFLTNTWRKLSDNLRMVIREDSDYPVHELDHAISRLCTIAGHQGVLVFPQRQITQAKLTSTNTKSNLESRKMNNDAGRLGGKFARRDYSKMRCGTCGELGHTTGYHDKFVSLQARGMANVARADENDHPSSQTNDGEDEQKEVEPNAFD